MSGNVCDSQDDFNVAFRKAVKENIKQERKKMGSWVYVYLVVFFVFLVWALFLSMNSPSDRVVNIVLAILFSPVYVIGYYLSMLKR